MLADLSRRLGQAVGSHGAEPDEVDVIVSAALAVDTWDQLPDDVQQLIEDIEQRPDAAATLEAGLTFHLPGRHDQLTHGHEHRQLPDGWSEVYDTTEIGRWADARLAKELGWPAPDPKAKPPSNWDRLYAGHVLARTKSGHEVLFTVDSTPSQRDRVFGWIDELHAKWPAGPQKITVQRSVTHHGDEVAGLATPGVMTLAGGVLDDDILHDAMAPSAIDNPGKTVTAHEWGHQLMWARGHDKSRDLASMFRQMQDEGPPSMYALDSPAEAYAEAFADWVAGGGDAKESLLISAAYADQFGWATP